eukprot:2532304-Rhodomonas_salina.2
MPSPRTPPTVSLALDEFDNNVAASPLPSPCKQSKHGIYEKLEKRTAGVREIASKLTLPLIKKDPKHELQDQSPVEQPRARRSTMPERTDPALLELQKMLADGVKSGTMKLVEPLAPLTSKPSPKDATLREIEDLLQMVRASEATGHCRILRR